LSNLLEKTMLIAVESELQRQVARLDKPLNKTFFEMLTYHMGWSGIGSGPFAAGKRIRPLLMLLTIAAIGENWELALPAAASIELIHNFSLVHDDIQDKSPLRRGRLAIWKKWGVAQAINVGDSLFIIAHLAMSDLHGKYSYESIFQATRVILEACLDLTCGQFMDIEYEKQDDLAIEDYWTMIAGKTAALLSASTFIGSILGSANGTAQMAYRDFGHYLGLAFQVQDDILGIWGVSSLTGKSNESDLFTGKMSLPVFYGLEKSGQFAKRWQQSRIIKDDIPELAELLRIDGAQLKAQETVDQMTELALKSLRQADPKGEAGEALYNISQRLIQRQS